ncbi:hypothetical protein L1049_009681 [Liquidambar formosana]|uniref:Uncharacterized protein n=1 Tax=Liquidambar formosana TaxID=63359 RepID=A0AAP0NA04_LIQFO
MLVCHLFGTKPIFRRGGSDSGDVGMEILSSRGNLEDEEQQSDDLIMKRKVWLPYTYPLFLPMKLNWSSS